MAVVVEGEVAETVDATAGNLLATQEKKGQPNGLPFFLRLIR
jgi:hypothetical protein